MKSQKRIEILQKVAKGSLTPEHADELLLSLSLCSTSFFPIIDRLIETAIDKDWIFYDGMWHKEGYSPRNTYDLYTYLFMK